MKLTTRKLIKSILDTDTICNELVITYKRHSKETPKIFDSKQIADYVRPLYSEIMEYREMCHVVSLNRNNQIIGTYELSSLGRTSCVFDATIIAQVAVMSNANGIILVHNHPSGNLRWSDADVAATKRAREALKIFDIPVIDSLILTEESYTSLADSNVI